MGWRGGLGLELTRVNRLCTSATGARSEATMRPARARRAPSNALALAMKVEVCRRYSREDTIVRPAELIH